MKDPAFLHPINGKYLTPWPLTPTGRLNGTVTGVGAGFKVTLTDTSGKSITAVTDASGAYTVLANAGTYSIKAAGALPNGVRAVTTTASTGTIAADKASDAAATTVSQVTLPNLPAPVDKAVYYDAGQSFGSVNDASAQKIRDYFKGKGYTVVDAAGLKTFMTSHVTSKKPSVVVTANDIFPDTVVDVSSGAVVNTGNDLVDYLNAGGRVVFSGDIPLYNISQAGTNLTAANGGSTTVFGFNSAGGTWDTGDKPVLTAAGQALGLTDTWQKSQRPAAPADVDLVLATSKGGAAGWIRFFPQGTGPGAFIRFIDTTEDDAGQKVDDNNILPDLQKLAEFSGAITVGGNVVLGDLNGDGKVNVQDATTSLRIAVGLITPSDAQKAAGDVNHDGKWNVQDATQILRAAVGLVTLG